MNNPNENCTAFIVMVSILAISLISGMIYGVLRNSGEPIAIDDEDRKREWEHAKHPKREFSLYVCIWIFVGIAWFGIMSNVKGF